MSSRKRTLFIAAIILGAILISVIANLTVSLIQRISYPRKYEELITQYASEYNVPEHVIYAVIDTESGFDPNAESSTGALGLMQIMPDTFKLLSSDLHLNESLDFEELTDPDVAIRYGTYYLRYLFDRFHKWNVVFAAYDAGEEQISDWLDDPAYSSDGETLKKIPTRETRNYVKKAERAQSYYKNTYYRNGVSVK